MDDILFSNTVKSAPSSRVAARLSRLRERFGPGVHQHQVDHDQDHLTSAARHHQEDRTFFLGEVWWADRAALGEHRPAPAGSSHRPALVTRREERPHQAVEMAPATRRAPEEIDELCFRPGDPPDGLREQSVFLLPYRRPVAREGLGGLLATLTGSDKQRLQQLLDALRS